MSTVQSDAPYLAFSRSKRYEEVLATATAKVIDLERFLFEEEVSRLVIQAESPIEALFLIALAEETNWHRKANWHRIGSGRGLNISIKPQMEIGPYRADVCITWTDTSLVSRFNGELLETPLAPVDVFVELDGHAFHELTKEQAAHDKKRDRWFRVNGFELLRFTGSEVHKDPFACAREALWHADHLFYYRSEVAP